MSGSSSRSIPSSANRASRRRRLGGLAAGALVGAGALALPGVVAAPGGASGTLHVLTGTASPGHQPHVGCDFRVELSGFQGALATVTVRPQGAGDTIHTADVLLAGGAGGVGVTLSPASLAALRPGPHGVHLEVRADTSAGARKSAVIWADCAPATDGGSADDDGTPDDAPPVDDDTPDTDTDTDTATDGPGNSDGTPGGGNTNTGGNSDGVPGGDNIDGPGNSDGTPGGGNTNERDGDDEPGDGTPDIDDTDVVPPVEDAEVPEVDDTEIVAGNGTVTTDPLPTVDRPAAEPAAEAKAAPFKAVLGTVFEAPPAVAAEQGVSVPPAAAPAPAVDAAEQVGVPGTLPRTGGATGTVAALGLGTASLLLLWLRRRAEAS